jgi:serine 3-dehydrogenase
MDLQDKVAVVTGASSGIGEAIARELSAAGAKLVITARREDRLASLSANLPTPSVRIAASIEDSSTPQALLDVALSEFGRVDVLVNNAGVFVAGSIDTIDLDEVSQMIGVNFEAVVRASYLFARKFKQQGSGAIVNVSSIGAYLSSSSVGVYSGLKHALEIFTSALRVELRGSGVRVGTIAPGTTETEIFDRLRAKGQSVRADQTPPLAPADIATAVRFMLEQPDRANVARMLLVSSSESV